MEKKTNVLVLSYNSNTFFNFCKENEVDGIEYLHIDNPHSFISFELMPLIRHIEIVKEFHEDGESELHLPTYELRSDYEEIENAIIYYYKKHNTTEEDQFKIFETEKDIKEDLDGLDYGV